MLGGGIQTLFIKIFFENSDKKRCRLKLKFLSTSQLMPINLIKRFSFSFQNNWVSYSHGSNKQILGGVCFQDELNSFLVLLQNL